MKLIRILFLVIAVIVAAGCPGKDPNSNNVKPTVPKTCVIHGYVKSSGEPLAGVSVSDGIEVTRTDEKGYYELTSSKKYGYVFISLPGGYMCERDGALPLFWRNIKGRTEREEHSFNLVKESNDNHQLIVSTDYHLGDRYDSQDLRTFEQYFIHDIELYSANNADKKIYGIVLGDSTWDIFWDKYNLERYASEAKLFPFTSFHVLGNHDYDMSFTDDFKAEDTYRKFLGPTFYSFNLGKCHYVVLDNIVYKNTFSGGSYTRNHDTYVSQEQLDWLQKDLENISTDTPIFICMHCAGFHINGINGPGGISPSLGFSDGSMQQRLANCLKDYTEVHFLTGDTHINQSTPPENMPSGYRNIYEHNMAAVSASWWWTSYISGNSICKDGSEGGYMIFTNNEKDVKWQFKSMKYDISKQFRTYDMNSIKSYIETDIMVPVFFNKYPNRETYSSFGKNDVLINVWNWDPRWTITVTENGVALPLTQHYLEDPLHTISYDIPRTFANGELTSSFRTIKTHHIFSVKASSESSTLEITATDGFGNVHQETMVRPKVFNVDMD